MIEKRSIRETSDTPKIIDADFNCRNVSLHALFCERAEKFTFLYVDIPSLLGSILRWAE